jgi:hypothetical protein
MYQDMLFLGYSLVLPLFFLYASGQGNYCKKGRRGGRHTKQELGWIAQNLQNLFVAIL